MLLFCWKIMVWAPGLLHYKLRRFSTMLHVHGEVNLLIKVTHKVHDSWSPTNNDDSTLNVVWWFATLQSLSFKLLVHMLIALFDQSRLKIHLFIEHSEIKLSGNIFVYWFIDIFQMLNICPLHLTQNTMMEFPFGPSMLISHNVNRRGNRNRGRRHGTYRHMHVHSNLFDFVIIL